MTFIRFLLLSCLALLAFDAVASAASLALRFSYESAAIGSYLIYLAFPLWAARKFGFWRAVLVGFVLGCVDATLGFAISWIIGPGRLPPGLLTPSLWALMLAFIVGLSTFYGLLGSAAGYLSKRPWRAA